MKIKFTGSEVKTQKARNGKEFKMTYVNGTAIGGKLDGQDYTTKFFTNNKELSGQVDELNVGDIVDIEMTKNGQYYNPTKFTSEGQASSGGSGGAPVGAPVNQRFENLKVAVDIMGAMVTGQEPFDYLKEAAGVADMIQDYVDKKGAFQFDNTSDDIPFEDDED